MLIDDVYQSCTDVSRCVLQLYWCQQMCTRGVHMLVDDVYQRYTDDVNRYVLEVYRC